MDDAGPATSALGALGAKAEVRTFPARFTILASLLVAYFVAGKLGLAFATVSPSSTVLWAPSGIALAGCLLFGYWIWPALLVGAFLVNITTAGSAATSLVIAAGNTLEPLVGAYFVCRFAGGRHVFETTRDALKFLLLAALLSTTVSPTIGVASLCIGGYDSWAHYGWIWMTWWFGDATGDLIVAPLLMLWAMNPRISWNRAQKQEALLLLLSMIVVYGVVFDNWLPLPSARYPIAYLCFPILLWAAFRFGPRETATATFILSGVGLYGTLNGVGPFAEWSRSESLLLLQSFAGLTGIMSIVVSIEVAARRRLEESRSRLAAIVDSSDDGIIAKTLEGRIMSWNTGATNLYHFEAPEAIGKPITIIIPAEKLAEEEELLSRLRHGETITNLETVRLRQDGQRIDVSLTVSPIRDPYGRIVGVSQIARDITEERCIRREREELLLSERAIREAAEAANRAKDEFLAMLGHELRNPLNAISLAARLLENDKAPETEKARSVIARQSSHVSRLVEDLLDVARVTSGRIILIRQPTNLADSVSGCLIALRETRQLEHHDIQTKMEAAWVDGDPDRLEQIVTNLLRNAVKYTPSGGKVLISVEAEGEDAVLRVEDNGIGISADFLPHVFDLFAQSEVGLARSLGGLGVGLTLVKRLVELHSGKVEALSAGRDLGSSFIVRLPRISGPAQTRSAATDSAPAVAMPRRILIVEDNQDVRESLREFLELSRHEVYEAGDGPSGVDQAAAMRPDVALIDVGLPDLDGYEVARRIRLTPAGREIILIALTGYAQQEYRERAEQAGFDGYLVKPVDPDELTQRVATLSAVKSVVPRPGDVTPPA